MPKGDKIRISELLTVHGIWIYKKIEPQRRANNKQWLCKDQARSVIVIDKKKRGKKFHTLYFWILIGQMFIFKRQSSTSNMLFL